MLVNCQQHLYQGIQSFVLDMFFSGKIIIKVNTIYIYEIYSAPHSPQGKCRVLCNNTGIIRHTETQSHAPTDKEAHTHARMHRGNQPHMHLLSLSLTHTHTHTHAHSHTHTHTSTTNKKINLFSPEIVTDRTERKEEERNKENNNNWQPQPQSTKKGS